MLGYLKRLFKEEFAKNVLYLVSGTAIGQLISILAYPLITRLYDPEAFGLYVIFNSLIGFFSVVGALKYEYAIPIAENTSKALNLLVVSLFILVGLNLILLIVLHFFGDTILGWFDATELGGHKYFIVLGVLFTSLYSILNQWVFRTKSFKKLSVTRVYRGLSLNISQIVFGYLNLQSLGLILGKLIGEFSGNSLLTKELFSKGRKSISEGVKYSEMKKLMRRYRKFPIFSVPTQVLNKLGLELPVFFIASMFGSDVVGLYGLAHTIVSLPMFLIGSAVGDVYYADAASLGKTNPEELKRKSAKILKRMILIGLIPLVILVLFGPVLFQWVFGEEWVESGSYARILAVLVFFRFVFSPLVRIFDVLEKQHIALWLDIMRVILVVSTFLLVDFLNLSSYTAITIYVVNMSFVYLVTFVAANKIVSNQFRH